jgi:hypothetical protein
VERGNPADKWISWISFIYCSDELVIDVETGIVAEKTFLKL